MLRLEGIRAGYQKGADVLHHLSLDVPKGHIIALIGSNGAGKTTCLRTISGFLSPRAGRILLQDMDISHLPPHDIAALGIAHCPEGRRVFSDLCVGDNLRLGAYTRTDTSQIKKDLEWVYTLFPRLAERRLQLAGTLSGGEQQMLAIGRALMLAPKILLLDEPSMGLAPKRVEEIFHILVTLKQHQMTMLLVEQFALAALSVADYGYVLENGTLRISGSASFLRETPEVKAAYLGHASG